MSDDLRSVEDLTPLPVLTRPGMTAAEADYLALKSAYDRLRLESAAIVAERDQLKTLNKQLHSDRRTLAARCQQLEEKLARMTGETR